VLTKVVIVDVYNVKGMVVSYIVDAVIRDLPPSKTYLGVRRLWILTDIKFTFSTGNNKGNYVVD